MLPEKRELKQNSKANNDTFTGVQVTTLTSTQRPNSSTQVLSFERFSSCNRLINVVSNVLPFLNSLRTRIDCHAQLTETEVRNIAIAKIIRQDQLQTLSDE